MVHYFIRPDESLLTNMNYMAMGQYPVPLVNIPYMTKLGFVNLCWDVNY